jgi:hypothetical protein
MADARRPRLTLHQRSQPLGLLTILTRTDRPEEAHHPNSQKAMRMNTPSDDDSAHLAALERSRQAGFVFVNLGHEAMLGQRWRDGTVEDITFLGATKAIAARFREQDYPRGDPLWQRHGGLEDVVDALLELPPHGNPDAPTLPNRISNPIWTPDTP